MLVKDKSKDIFKVPHIMYNQYLNTASIFRTIYHISKFDDRASPISITRTIISTSTIRNPVKYIYMSRNSFFYDRFYVLDRVRCKATKNIRSLPGEDND